MSGESSNKQVKDAGKEKQGWWKSPVGVALTIVLVPVGVFGYFAIGIALVTKGNIIGAWLLGVPIALVTIMGYILLAWLAVACVRLLLKAQKKWHQKQEQTNPDEEVEA